MASGLQPELRSLGLLRGLDVEENEKMAVSVQLINAREGEWSAYHGIVVWRQAEPSAFTGDESSE